VLSATLPPASAATADVHTIAQGVDNHYNHLKSFQAEFTELYRGNGIDRIESGTLWLKKPRKMRWEYRSPREKLFVSNGQDAWFYVPGERQARREPFKKLEDMRSPLGFLLGKTKLEKELKGLSIAMDVKPMQAGDTVLRGTPKGMEDRVSQVLVEVTPESHIFRIVLQGTDDAVTEYRFTEVKEDQPLADNKFRFEPPAGVETIEGEIGQ
jgi:outer membrane lipoprotein carrier protein